MKTNNTKKSKEQMTATKIKNQKGKKKLDDKIENN